MEGVLKQMPKKQGVRIWTGFNWLRKESSTIKGKGKGKVVPVLN
jgi:hypothetical protein